MRAYLLCGCLPQHRSGTPLFANRQTAERTQEGLFEFQDVISKTNENENAENENTKKNIIIILGNEENECEVQCSLEQQKNNATPKWSNVVPEEKAESNTRRYLQA
jgi:hypothetical protein